MRLSKMERDLLIYYRDEMGYSFIFKDDKQRPVLFIRSGNTANQLVLPFDIFWDLVCSMDEYVLYSIDAILDMAVVTDE